MLTDLETATSLEAEATLADWKADLVTDNIAGGRWGLGSRVEWRREGRAGGNVALF